MNLWQKYFTKELTKAFLLFIFCFFGLYVVVDFSSRYLTYKTLSISWTNISFYYLYILILRLEILIPFAYIIGCIKTLTQLNIHNELVALMASGISLRKLLRPFLLFGCFLALLLYANTQFLIPHAAKEIRQIEASRSKHKYKREGKINSHILPISGGGILLYHAYDEQEQLFFDTYWMPNPGKIYRIKYLSPFTSPAQGKLVDSFVRNEKGLFLLESTQEKQNFPKLKISLKTISEVTQQPAELSFLQLLSKVGVPIGPMSDYQALIATTLYRKLTLPWLGVIMFLIIAPFCIRFSRDLPLFMIYLCAMIGLIAFYLMMNAAVILGENQALPPIVAMLAPPLLATILGGWHYLNKTR